MSIKQIEEILSELVAIPSISSADAHWDQSNRQVIDRLAERFESLGFSIQIQEVTDNHGKNGKSDKANLIANIGSGHGGLVLAGHTDTVPFDESQWDSDPFTLENRDNRLHGLGSTDMKGFFAVVLSALTQIGNKKLSALSKPLTIIATADEESSMSGARALSDADPFNARFAVIGEPTDMKPVRMHKGIMMESIALTGQSGHSSNPALGHSALDAMHKVMSALMDLRREWAQQYQNAKFEVQVPTMNLAAIHGGDSPNRICQHCQLTFDVRLLPGMNNAEMREIIQQCARHALQGTGVSASFNTLFTGVEPYLQDENSELITTVEKLTGHQAKSAGYATEAPFMQALGMQTVVLGPGSIDTAHQANEYLPLDQVDPAVDLIHNLINRFCV